MAGWDYYPPIVSCSSSAVQLSSGDLVHAAAIDIVERALVLLRDRRGVDFSGHRRSTIQRRLANRMIAVRVTEGERYLALLDSSELELDALAANLAVKVSRFYRNATTFDLLARCIEARRTETSSRPLRVWSAGCACGEEAYTLAMLLRDGDRIDATDVDRSALVAAEAGRYERTSLVETPPELRERFLVPGDRKESMEVTGELRKRVRFFHHDLAHEASAPAGSYDLICCRNVLIYFDRPLQQRVMRLLVDALDEGGILCLGEAEWPLEDRGTLAVIDRKSRIFRRVATRRDA